MKSITLIILCFLSISVCAKYLPTTMYMEDGSQREGFVSYPITPKPSPLNFRQTKKGPNEKIEIKDIKMLRIYIGEGVTVFKKMYSYHYTEEKGEKLNDEKPVLISISYTMPGFELYYFATVGTSNPSSHYEFISTGDGDKMYFISNFPMIEDAKSIIYKNELATFTYLYKDRCPKFVEALTKYVNEDNKPKKRLYDIIKPMYTSNCNITPEQIHDHKLKLYFN